MKRLLGGTLACLLSCSALAWQPAAAVGYTQTKYPIVMVPGIFGFDSIAGVEYFYQIPESLSSSGATVYVAEPSALNDETVRGEQVLQYVQQVLAITGAKKVNLIGHSQGGFDIRYVAAVRPDLVASVTSVATPHTGTPLANILEGLESSFPGISGIFNQLWNAFGGFISLLSGGKGNPQNTLGALAALSSAGTAQFNALYPQGLPTTACGNGPASVNGVNYYSWGGTSLITDLLDPSDYFLSALSLAFVVAPSANDGLVPQCGSHLGTVIADNYGLNHIDEVNHLFGLHGSTDPVSLYRQQANRLQQAGL